MISRHVSQVIRRSADEVYAYAVDPDNLPMWAAGLAAGELSREGEELVMDSPMGQVRVRFASSNQYGVLDHDVTLPTGVVVHNPLRVLAHPEGAEVVFTLRQLDLNEEEFDRDEHAVAADLERLRQQLEA